MASLGRSRATPIPRRDATVVKAVAPCPRRIKVCHLPVGAQQAILRNKPWTVFEVTQPQIGMTRIEIVDKRLGHAACGFSIKVDDGDDGPDQPLAHRKACDLFLGRSHPELPLITEPAEPQSGVARLDPTRCRICQACALCLGDPARKVFRQRDKYQEYGTVQNCSLGGTAAGATMSGVPVAEPVMPGKKSVIAPGLRRSDRWIINAAPDICPKVALSRIVDLGQEPPRQPIGQRHEVCFGDRLIGRF